ncbi:transcription initiation factor TFIID subunit 9-like [Sipha flava]|uniref:Transcription initiation factor TFIID subunit 9 n=1 Tax=Sipha flava TaxID=143950 RepID=A0A2S2PZM2_9HEMI|nr:transcription initiation factor TFIID subunit 9-like [Sipha flava]
MSSSKDKLFIKDSQVMKSIMKELGIKDFDEQVIRHLLGFNYKYSTMILEDAQRYSKFANKDNIDVDDVKLAIHFSQDKLLIKPPDREALMAASKEINNKALPPIKNTKGLHIPQSYRFASEYQLKTDLKSEKEASKSGTTTITTAAEILEDSKRRNTKKINKDNLVMDDLLQYDFQETLATRVNSEGLNEEIIGPQEFEPNFFNNNLNQY